MARLDKSNHLLQGVSGALGKQLVIKQYGDRTVLSAYPSMPVDKPTALQGIYRGVFKEAVAYAQSVVRSPETKAIWQERIGEGKSVYHAALKAYLAEHKVR